MLNYLLLFVMLPCLITATTLQCPNSKVACPEGKPCCFVDAQYECCESPIPGQAGVKEPRLAAAMHGNFKNDSLTVQNGIFDPPCNFMTCSGTCCTTYGCCPFVNAACCHQGNTCCRNGQVCCALGCCEAGHTCCGNGCCLSSSICCNDKSCCPYGSTCCSNGGCCVYGKYCCGNGCCSVESQCCGGNKCCPSGTKCCNGLWCCKNSQKCGLHLNTCLSPGMTLVPTVSVLVSLLMVSIMSTFSII